MGRFRACPRRLLHSPGVIEALWAVATSGLTRAGGCSRVVCSGVLVLRCTTKLQKVVGRPDPATATLPISDDDWYANLLWVGGRKCLLVTHAGTLLSIFVPDVRARDLRPLGTFVVPLIGDQLNAEGFRADALGILDGSEVRIAKTAERSVLGCMNDLALTCEHAVADAGGLSHLDLVGLHRRLQRNITNARGYVPAVELVAGRQGSLTRQTE